MAQSAVSITAFGTSESWRVPRADLDPTTMRSASSSAATLVIASAGSDDHGVRLDRDGLARGHQPEFGQQQLDRIRSACRLPAARRNRRSVASAS